MLIDPFNTNILYAGSVSGGVWKSLDGGQHWTPMSDFIPNINISTMVMDPLDRNTLYAGTGEPTYSDRGIDQNGLPGSGIFKSTDGGNTWVQLNATRNWQYVYRLAMQPATSGVLLAGLDDGVWRSADGGTSWTHVYTPTYVHTTVVAFDPNNGNRAVAYGDACCAGGLPYMQLIYSNDGGVTWLNSTMPRFLTSLASIAAAWGPSSNVYFNVGAPGGSGYGEIWRSQNGGASYTLTSEQGVTQCTSNHCAIWVSPVNPNLIVTGGLYNFRSTDGGETFEAVSYGSMLSDEPHVDNHWLVNDPVNPNKLYVCNDGGVYRTNDITAAAPGNGSWVGLNATYQTTQYYSGAGINDGAAWPLIGGTQDNGALRVSVNDQLTPAYRPASSANLWAFGCDGGRVAIDFISPLFMYGECQFMQVFRSSDGGEPNGATFIHSGLSGPSNFIAPLVMDGNDPNLLLSGGDRLWRTTQASLTPSWTIIRAATTPPSNISAIATAKTDSNIIWVGQNDGRLQKTTNGLSGSPAFVDIDSNTPPSADPLPNRAILRILIDPADARIVYVALGGYSINSPQPQNLWRTTNGGTTWSPVSGGGITALPMVPIRTIARHPRNRQRLYVGTDIGIYESEDYGATWSTSQQGPADVSVDELAFVRGSELLLAATHGRGMWTADTSSVPSFGPTSVDARASGTTAVTVTWTGVAGATSYQVVRSSDGAAYANAPGGLVSTPPYNDPTVTSGKTYLYKVSALVDGLWTDLSAPDLATTIAFTDDNALLGKIILASHLQEMRTAVNAVMTAAGQVPTFPPATPGATMLATDVINLRNALTSAYVKIGMPSSPAFSEAITPALTPIRASHFQEIRDASK